MTKKDYAIIARAVKAAQNLSDEDDMQGIQATAVQLAYHLKEDTPRSDSAKFLAACGLD